MKFAKKTFAYLKFIYYRHAFILNLERLTQKGKFLTSLYILCHMKNTRTILWQVIWFSVFMTSCRNKASIPSKQSIDQLNLKRGELISCGAPDKQFGIVDFEMSCDKKVKQYFNLAMELLH